MLYHSNVFMPKRIKGLFPKDGTKTLTYSQHAREQSARKEISLPTSINLTQYDIIELEVQAGQWTKAVIRQQVRYAGTSSVVLVVMKGDERTRYFVKTLWMNSVDDEHATLDPSPYVQR
jgi:hypothetical protein